MLRALKRASVLAIVSLVASTGCNTPDTVSKFCASSNSTLATAIAAFRDLPASCLRAKNLTRDIGTFELIQKDPQCSQIAEQSDGAVAASQALIDYFAAINSLATFNTAHTASDASDLASKTAAAFSAQPEAQKAIGSIATFLTTVATSGYQQKSINNDLKQVSANVSAVVKALSAILQENYINQALTKDEESKLASHYKDFSVSHTGGDVALQLDDRWRADEKAIVAKRQSAQALITALGAIQKGVANLAANANSLKAKEIPAMLDPYVSQLQTLIPQVQKAF